MSDLARNPKDRSSHDAAHLIIAGNVPCYRKVVNWICGIDNATGSSSIANKQVEMPEMLSIKEDRRWKIVSNTAAVIAMMVVIALCIVFG